MRRALLLCVLVLAGAALAQEEGLGGPSKEPTADMLRVCPELKGAIGRRKDQLLALFFDYGSLDAKKARALFDPSEDSAFLEGFLNEKGRYRVQSGMRAVIAGLGSSGFAWALDRFENGKPEARGRVLDALQAVPYRECWRFLETRLDDARPVPNWRASQEAPPGYKDLRICDHALVTLGARLQDVTSAPSTQVGSLMPATERDARIAKVREFLAKDKAYQAHLAKAPSVADDLDARAKALLKKLGVE